MPYSAHICTYKSWTLKLTIFNRIFYKIRWNYLRALAPMILTARMSEMKKHIYYLVVEFELLMHCKLYAVFYFSSILFGFKIITPQLKNRNFVSLSGYLPNFIFCLVHKLMLKRIIVYGFQKVRSEENINYK